MRQTPGEVCDWSWKDPPGTVTIGEPYCCECRAWVVAKNDMLGIYVVHHKVPIPPVPPQLKDSPPKNMPGTPLERLRHHRKRCGLTLQFYFRAPEEDYHKVVDKAFKVWESTIRIHQRPFPHWVEQIALTGELYEGELSETI